MGFLRAHPYLDALVTASAVIIVGVLVVRTQLAAPIQPATDATWGSEGGVFVNTVSDGRTTLAPTESGPNFQAKDLGYIPLATQNEIGTGPHDASADFDFAAFAAALSRPKTARPVDTSETSSAYDFIPTGLLATTTLAKPRTSLQNQLYMYGNEVGDTIVSFENSHPDQPAILKNQMEQRDDPSAIAALKGLGNDLAHVGDTLAAMELVPTQAKSAHLALADAYRNIGTKLAAVPDARGDDAIFEAIVTYNASAEDFAKKYVSLAQIFQAYDVTFSPGDGGSLFVFPSGGL